MSSPRRNAVLLVVDIETTGQSRFQHWMPCFAGCIVTERGSPQDGRFLCYLEQPENREWDALCRRDFWDNPKLAVEGRLLSQRLSEDAERQGRTHPTLGIARFVSWVQRMVQRYPNLQIASDNPSFDVAWIDHYIQQYCEKPPFATLAYCTGEWKAILDLRTWTLARGRKLKPPGDHNPLNDAMLIGSNYFE